MVTAPSDIAACNEAHTQSRLLQAVVQKIEFNNAEAGFNELEDVENILSNSTLSNATLSDNDIRNVAHVLESVHDVNKLNVRSIKTVINIVNKLLDSDEVSEVNLQKSQQKTGTSNSLLHSLDKILSEAPIHSSKEFIVKEKVTAFLMNTEGNTYKMPSGIGIKQTNVDLGSQNIVEIPHNASLQWVLDQNFSAAVILPKYLLHSLSNNPHRLSVTVFPKPTLFGGTSRDHISGYVVGVSIDGKHMELEKPIILLFERKTEDIKTNNSQELNKCRFWDFDAENGKGKWSPAGCTLAEYPNSSSDICVCTHLTHFGKLLYNNGNNEIKMFQESTALDLVTIIGCSLSLLGLAGVFLSAALFPGEGTGRWIQLQLCAAQAVLMTAILWDAIASYSTEKPTLCFLRGLLLHWSVLALGIWTFAAALFQHRRLTQPLHALHTDPLFLPIFMVLSWGGPVVVCFIVALLDTHAYEPPSCYPLGITLFISVMLPLGCIVVVNSIIFLLIVWSICNCNSHSVTLRNSQDKKSRIVQQAIASSYLFCLLGLCWLFGFLHLQYLFCITASLQGVSHFIFCVLLDRTTRRSWQLYKKRSQMRFTSMKSWTHTSLLPSIKSKQSSKCDIEKTRI